MGATYSHVGLESCDEIGESADAVEPNVEVLERCTVVILDEPPDD
jgi:hypothetical protein